MNVIKIGYFFETSLLKYTNTFFERVIFVAIAILYFKIQLRVAGTRFSENYLGDINERKFTLLQADFQYEKT